MYIYLFILIYFFTVSYAVDWKPETQYYDYVAQSTEKKPVKQVFPYVKVYLYLFTSTGFLTLVGCFQRFARLRKARWIQEEDHCV
jgi:hypothetical protein